MQFQRKEGIFVKTVHIEGMMCNHCVAHVKKALEALDPKVEVSLAEKCAKVRDDLDNAALTKAVADAGYEVVGID